MNFSYPVGSIDSVVEFLAHDIDEYKRADLMQHYDCVDLEDLAVAITDAELEHLGYPINTYDITEVSGIPTEGIVEAYHDDNTTDSDFELYNYNSNYSAATDMLEDVPYNIPVSIIDVCSHTDEDDDTCIFGVPDETAFFDLQDNIDSSLVSELELLSDDLQQYDGLTLFSAKPYDYEISEAVLNACSEDITINTELNPDLFDNETNRLLESVRDNLLSYANGFIEFLKDNDVGVDVHDIQLVGSNAGYLYDDTSDVDIHIIINDSLVQETAEALYSLADLYESEHPEFVGDDDEDRHYSIELGIEDATYSGVAMNKRRYSILNNNWVNQSDEIERYKPDDISDIEGYLDLAADFEKQIDAAIESDSLNEAILLKKTIRQNRSDDLAEKGSLSMGNAVFRELRNSGAYGRLRDYIAEKEQEQILQNNGVPDDEST